MALEKPTCSMPFTISVLQKAILQEWMETISRRGMMVSGWKASLKFGISMKKRYVFFVKPVKKIFQKRKDFLVSFLPLAKQLYNEIAWLFVRAASFGENINLLYDAT